MAVDKATSSTTVPKLPAAFVKAGEASTLNASAKEFSNPETAVTLTS